LVIFSILSRLRIFPNSLFLIKPHKIFEFKQIIKQIDIQKEDIVLDFGCGIGIQTLLIGKKCKKIIGIDVSKQAINWARFFGDICSNKINSDFFCKKLQIAKFKNNFFNVVFSICVLEHILKKNETLNEIHRIMKPGGLLVISVDALTPIKSLELLKKHKEDHDVENYFTEQYLNTILSDIGFRDIHIMPILKSNYAINFFSQGIKFGFKKRIDFLSSYFCILMSEKRTTNKEGIFLIAKCKK
jgi:ubiquinone/menaquinone biosynthesis C-methylase UbiE